MTDHFRGPLTSKLLCIHFLCEISISNLAMKAIYTGKKEEAGKSYIQKYKYLVCQSKSWKKNHLSDDRYVLISVVFKAKSFKSLWSKFSQDIAFESLPLWIPPLLLTLPMS